ncbi:lipopolysaccharide biosynthesis protein [Acetohalobium arabaticum]|uniref:Polysaccharide biosynthesis protein n=1 Tax=Acetohalobium arabaticum (strain ATCC 49924 / DSM 5501 / Z-7288) TaxID=574087 RepID=D9QTB5_ACEAZ|nr:lipopolysaccharide biosynthesis protein [Acetohalobium arabaticum]ADL13615.1 polysaccharide biosynthesis protein [Acetohalobium arabaticum DSM 5501]
MKKENNSKNKDNKNDSLAKKTIDSSLWMFGSSFLNKGFKFTRKIILARILAPEDFGLFGIALLILSASDSLTKTGFNKALIQKQKEVEKYLNTAWTIQVMRGGILFLVLFSTAPIIALFFNEPLAIPILRVLAIAQIFKGVQNIGMIYFDKRLQFNKKFIYTVSGTVFDFTVSIIAAYILKNAWALVWGVLVGSIVKCMISFILHPYRPSLNFSIIKAKELFDFGKWKLATSFIVFFAVHLDDIIVGRILGTTKLGLFQMAFQLSNITASEISYVVSKVAFASYSKLQNDKKRLNIAYLRILELVVTISLPMIGGMIILAPLGIKLVLGEKWMPMLYSFRVLTIGGLFRTLSITGGALFDAVGFPKGDFMMNKWRFISLSITIIPFTYMWGLNGAAMTSGLALLVSLIPLIKNLSSILEQDLGVYLKLSIIPFISSLIMIGVILCSYEYEIIKWFYLIKLILLGSLVYFTLLYLFDKFNNLGPWTNIKWLLKKLL